MAEAEAEPGRLLPLLLLADAVWLELAAALELTDVTAELAERSGLEWRAALAARVGRHEQQLWGGGGVGSSAEGLGCRRLSWAVSAGLGVAELIGSPAAGSAG